jgi:hypothetical protein
VSGREELQPQPSTDKRREEIARIARQTFEGALNETYPCQRCAGHGFHHGFGEDGCDPDWCADCGGSGFNGPTDDEAWLKAVDAIMALFANPEQSPEPVQNLHEFDGEWRDIASAPKDGTHFLASVDGEVRLVAWGKTSHVPMYGFCLADQGVEDFDLCKPTHWRPLPAPPSNPETKGEA